MFKKITNYIQKSPHRNSLEKYIFEFLPQASGAILDIGSKNRRYDFLLKTKPISIDIKENKEKEVISGNINNLEFADETFDSIVCLEVLEYIDTPEVALSEMSRVVKKGGTLFLSVPFMYKQHDDMLRYTNQYLEKELSKHFSSVEILPVGNAYTIILDVLKDRINKISFRLLRYICLLPYLPFALISDMTSPAKRSGFVSGYFVIAQKI